VNARHSFGCCLGETLEREKIRILQSEIETSFGRQPAIFVSVKG
jgi:hypothetical protein